MQYAITVFLDFRLGETAFQALFVRHCLQDRFTAGYDIDLLILQREVIFISFRHIFADQREQIAVTVDEICQTFVVGLLDAGYLQREITAGYDRCRRYGQLKAVFSAQCFLEDLRQNHGFAQELHLASCCLCRDRIERRNLFHQGDFGLGIEEVNLVRIRNRIDYVADFNIVTIDNLHDDVVAFVLHRKLAQLIAEFAVEVGLVAEALDIRHDDLQAITVFFD